MLRARIITISLILLIGFLYITRTIPVIITTIAFYFVLLGFSIINLYEGVKDNRYITKPYIITMDIFVLISVISALIVTLINKYSSISLNFDGMSVFKFVIVLRFILDGILKSKRFAKKLTT
ncbi:hypothetical protein GC105_16460 [Alkalibaculum sp. M08DMB]|uniref:Uncharacterized protein n=1 Tax=Alkalibaculum sporogenes TaxID=2655001 RepID=A0A6A7KCW0_9FIRM|nr:hypothetical protein [Alkalibaculum sporogenes]MPW27358.1 hypothetical protein [Alkalibaculum sporogenes]